MVNQSVAKGRGDEHVHDWVEPVLSKGQREFRIRQTEIQQKFQLYRWIVAGVAAVLCVVALAIPLRVVSQITDAFNESSLNIGGATVFAIVLSITVGGGGIKISLQTRDKRRLRDRITDLEDRIDEVLSEVTGDS